jgi:hypothetical protein
MASYETKDGKTSSILLCATTLSWSLDDALRGEETQVDPALPDLTTMLCAAGDSKCWHKHSTFLALT